MFLIEKDKDGVKRPVVVVDTSGNRSALFFHTGSEYKEFAEMYVALKKKFQEEAQKKKKDATDKVEKYVEKYEVTGRRSEGQGKRGVLSNEDEVFLVGTITTSTLCGMVVSALRTDSPSWF